MLWQIEVDRGDREGSSSTPAFQKMLERTKRYGSLLSGWATILTGYITLRRHWRFMLFATRFPVSNDSFLCLHGGGNCKCKRPHSGKQLRRNNLRRALLETTSITDRPCSGAGPQDPELAAACTPNVLREIPKPSTRLAKVSCSSPHPLTGKATAFP